MMNLLLGAALKGTLLLAVACGAAFAARRGSANLRRKIWLAALLAMAALLIPAPAVEPARIAALMTRAGSGAALRGRVPVSWSHWALWLWMAGAMLVALRIAAGIAGLARITRKACRVLGNVYTSKHVSTPLTWGALRPVILLPAYASGWTAEKRDWAIRHEQAHIAARDWLWQTFSQAMTAVFWFHPLVWLAAAKLRAEAERAADDAVLCAGADAPEYASQLVEVARHWGASSVAAAVGMVHSPAIENRIAAILNPALRRRPASRAAVLAIFATMAALVVPLAAYQSAQGGEVHHIGEPGLSAPRVLSKVDPEYTQEARAAKIQGVVILSVEIDEYGHAQNITVTRSLDPGLDANAAAAVEVWTFQPGEKDGKPVRVAATIEVNFRLQ